jgi:hypothetical protein
MSLSPFDFVVVVAKMEDANANFPAGANQAEDAKEAQVEAQEDAIA